MIALDLGFSVFKIFQVKAEVVIKIRQTIDK